MDLLQAAVLGIVQGITEFLPISSSGHLIIVPYLFGWQEFENNLPFDVALHLGTTAGLLLFFWKDWYLLVTGFLKQLFDSERKLLSDPHSRLFLTIILGSIPAALFGFYFQDFVEGVVRDPLIIGEMLIGFGLILYWAEKRGNGRKNLEQIRLRDGLIIGIWQAVSLIPGVSRSGSTISGGFFQGLDRETATRFSFLLATPAVAGAALFKVKDIMELGFGSERGVFLVGFLASLVSGLLVIKFLLQFIKTNSFTVFVVYRILLGMILIGLVATGYS